MGGDSSLWRRFTRQLQFDYDTWHSIFEKLESTIDQNSFSLTCVTFRDIRNSSCKSLKLRCITTIDHSSIIDFSIIDKLLSRHTKLESLTLGCPGNCLHITDSCLTPLLKYGSTLHSLDLNSCGRVTDTGLILVAPACPLLSVISLGSTSVSDNGLKILSKSCKSLKEVNLQYCTGVTDNGIFFLNKNCLQLRTLRISGCRNINGIGFRECSPTLAHLEAYNCYLGGSMGVSQIVSGGGLEYLNLGRWSYGSRRRFSIVKKPIRLGGFCSKLKYLNIASRSFVDDDLIVKISRGCPLLQEWNLTNCNRIGILGWESIGLYCQNLEILHVAACENLCEERGLVSIGAGCKRLSMIIVDESQYGSDEVNHFRLQRMDVEIKRKGSLNPLRSWGSDQPQIILFD